MTRRQNRALGGSIASFARYTSNCFKHVSIPPIQYHQFFCPAAFIYLTNQMPKRDWSMLLVSSLICWVVVVYAMHVFPLHPVATCPMTRPVAQLCPSLLHCVAGHFTPSIKWCDCMMVTIISLAPVSTEVQTKCPGACLARGYSYHTMNAPPYLLYYHQC